jgi:hypothetical protein
MGAVVPTLVKATEFSGDYKLKVFTMIPAATSDTLDLSTYFSEIVGCMGKITAGVAAACTMAQVSYSTTTVTVKTLKADGATAADAWTNVVVEVWVLGKLNKNAGS